MKIQILLLAALVLLTSNNTFAANQPPKGAVKLSSKNIVKNDGFFCGLVGKKWVPGKKVSGGYFYPNTAERTNILAQAKQATGKKKKSLQAKAASLKLKISERQPICINGVNGNNSIPTSTPTPSVRPLRFDFSNASGIALKPVTAALKSRTSALSASSSNLQKVTADGSIASAVTSGNAAIRKFLIGPNNKLYVLFSQRVNLQDTTKQFDPNGCLLAEIDAASGNPVCIDNTLNQISWEDFRFANKPIQFDASGAIFYSGYDSSNKRVLRKNAAGIITDLITDNVSLYDFLVLADGRVIITGITSSSNARWIRRVSTNGGLTNLYTSTNAQFIRQFPDGNVYLGTWGDSTFGIVRYLTNSDTVDPQTYIVGEGLNGFTFNPLFDANPFCDNGQAAIYQGFCGSYGAYIKGLSRTTSDKIFVIAGSGDNGVLMEYYPSLARPTTVVRKVAVSQGVLNQIILAGLNSSNKNVMTLFNTDNNSEIQLIGSDNEIEVYHLNYSAAQNAIIFDGLRFSDNKYVIGRYDLNSMSLTASSTGSTKLEDLQTFN